MTLITPMRVEIARLWGEGRAVAEIATALHTTTSSVTSLMVLMRRDGWELPLRSSGRKVFVRQSERGARDAAVFERDRLKARARSAVTYAIKMGRLVRPCMCSRCGGDDRIQAHHPDYSKPLDVEWLCLACHRTLHSREREKAAA
jgi:hypothetical protein